MPLWTPTNEPGRILFADGEEEARVRGCELLESEGYGVTVASTGPEAVRALPASRPDLVIVDSDLSGMNGFEVCRRVVQDPRLRGVPVLMLTRHDDAETIALAQDSGISDLMEKPIRWPLFLTRVRSLLQSGEAIRNLRLHRERLARAQQVAGMGYWEVDLASQIFDCSDEIRELCGLPRDDAPMHFDRLLEIVHPDDRQDFIETLHGAIEAGIDFDFVHRLLVADGSMRTVHVQGGATSDPGKDRVVASGISQDITERRLHEERAHRLAGNDRLTGLGNRDTFTESLIQVIAHKHEAQQVGVLMLDLDDFRRVNDTLGHGAGDELLQQVAGRMVQSLRRLEQQIVPGQPALQPSLWRMGGDEFAVLLSDLPQARDCARVARHVHTALRDPFSINGEQLVVTASIGIAVHPDDGDDSETLLRNADAAMYHAKRRGRNTYQFYTDSMNAEAQDRLATEQRVRRALEEDTVEVHFQPKIDLKSGRIAGSEALVRIRHPDFGLLQPSHFIPVCEETQLILQVGECVLRKACAQNQSWAREGFDSLRVSVNLSCVQFNDPGLVGTIERVLDETGLDPSLLDLEITESALMHNEHDAVALLQRLRAWGISISMDDFGTGYSSMSYLKVLPLDALKIDQSFVRGLQADASDAAIIEAIISMAKALQLKTVAEGVETEAQQQLLSRLGCDQLQGYLFSPPVPAEEFAAYYRARST